MVYFKNYKIRTPEGMVIVVGQHFTKAKTPRWGVPTINGQPIVGINNFKTRKAAIKAAKETLC